MATRFDSCLRFVLSVEGGLTDDPDDLGGLTNMGITIGVYSAYLDEPITPALREQLKTIPMSVVADIYVTRYWNLVKAGQLPDGLDLCAFDFGVNSGPGRSVRILQEVLGVTADGFIGPKTLKAVLSRPLLDLCNAFIDARLAYLTTRPTYWKHGLGWRNRCAKLRKHVHKELTGNALVG